MGKSGQFIKFVAILLMIKFICIGIYLYWYDQITTNNNMQNVWPPSHYQRNNNYLDGNPPDDELDSAYLVKNVGCKIPSFLDEDETIIEHFKDVTEKSCKIPLTQSNHKHLWISLNETEMKHWYNIDDVTSLHCHCLNFYRKNDSQNIFQDQMVNFRYGDLIEPKTDFVQVICTYGKKGVIYKNYHVFFPLRRPRLQPPPNKEPLKVNVIVLGLNSLSRLNFQRQMNSTFNILMKKLKTYEMLGYTNVAENRYSNLIPALTGLNVNELNKVCLPYANSTYDNCPFIWNKYKMRGYKTAMAEDRASLGLFNDKKHGFYNQPVHFSSRPILMELENMESITNESPCLGGKRTIQFFTDYITKFLYASSSRPFFSLFWSSAYTHCDYNQPKLVDKDYTQLINALVESQLTQNTFLMIMSDQGLSKGPFAETYQGAMEQRQPLQYLIPPPWFSNLYRVAVKNLKMNRRKLTTHYDLHETLFDLANLTRLTPESLMERTKALRTAKQLPRGISLFLPIPSTRTCQSAGIAPHLCTCHEESKISTDLGVVVYAALEIVQRINLMLQPYSNCSPLTLLFISDAIQGISNKQIYANRENYFSDITIRLKTQPGNGEYEATVRLHSNGRIEITGTISRIILNGKHSQYIYDHNIKLYCCFQ